ADVAHRGLHDIAVTKVLVDRPGLGGRLDDHEISSVLLCHAVLRLCVTGGIGPPAAYLLSKSCLTPQRRPGARAGHLSALSTFCQAATGRPAYIQDTTRSQQGSD